MNELGFVVEPVWLQQPDEPDWMYGIFRLYLQQPPGRRNKSKAWRDWARLQGRDPARSIPDGTFFQRAKQWRWEERARIYDRERMLKLEQSWLERELEIRERNYQAGLKLYEKAIRALESLGDEEIPASLVARFLELAADLQERALPKTQLDEARLARILESIPPDRRARVLSILVAEVD